MTDLERLAELGRPVRDCLRYDRSSMRELSPHEYVQRADAALAERMASEVELAEENKRLKQRVYDEEQRGLFILGKTAGWVDGLTRAFSAHMDDTRAEWNREFAKEANHETR